jgi:catechol 2,3-dioxygenase-like lactoylglutathione lyase family enzyme
MLHHLTLWVPDLARAQRSWRWLLGCLGYDLDLDRAADGVLVFRHPDGFTIALEQSPDMVPGMLYSRFRPGLNHLAFKVRDLAMLDDLARDAGGHGWSEMPTDGLHPIAGGAEVAYLEDQDGFEVELVVANPTGENSDGKPDS